MTCLIILHTIYPQHVAINFDCVRIFFGRKEPVEDTIKITLENIKRWIFIRTPPFPFKCVVFVPLHKRTIFIDFKYPQQCVFLLRWWREVIWLKLEINAISQFDDILRQAAFQCNVCTGRICLRIKLKKKEFLKIQRCWLFILRQCLASLVFSDLATRWVVYWIRSAGEPGEKIAELGQIFTNQLYLFWYFLSYLSLYFK